jgi:hypothetical protein
MQKSLNDIDGRAVRLWSWRLRKLIREAPDGITALVGHSKILICETTELRKYEDEKKHRDNPPSIEIISSEDVFEPNSESL